MENLMDNDMAHYIDTDRLRKEVKRLERAAHRSALDCADSETRKFHEGKALAYQFVGMLIDSLQQEQPVEGLDVTDFCKPVDPGIAKCVADHWWEMIGEESTNKKSVEGLEEAAENIYKTPFGTRAEDFIAGAEWMAGQGWISVDEKLPKMDEDVIVLTDELGTAPIYKIAFGHIVDVEHCIDYNGWNCPGVKFWMPCPKILNND